MPRPSPLVQIELMTQQRLQQELYQSKTDEASLLRAKEEVTMKLETAEMLRRSLERDKRWLNDTLDDAKKRIQALEVGMAHGAYCITVR